MNKKLINEFLAVHPRPWNFQLYGPDDEWIRDNKGNALVHVGYNSAQRQAVGDLIVKLVNEADV